MNSFKKKLLSTTIWPVSSIILILLFSRFGCYDSIPLESPGKPGIIEGTVLNITWAGGVPENWNPPRYLQKCTIILLDNDKRHLKEFSTNNEGSFQIEAVPDTYYLFVKESPAKVETGPYYLKESQTLNVLAYFDVGLK